MIATTYKKAFKINTASNEGPSWARVKLSTGLYCITKVIYINTETHLMAYFWLIESTCLHALIDIMI